MIPYYRPRRVLMKSLMSATWDINKSGKMSNGENVLRLEERIKKVTGFDYVTAVSSCTQGLIIAARIMNFKKVSMPAFTWSSLKFVMEFNGTKVEYADIDPKTLLMKHTDGAEMPTHTFGNLYENETGLIDGAWALGTKRISEQGYATVLSMAPTKLFTAGEGGLICTNYPTFDERAKAHRVLLSRMSELNAAVGLESLRNYKEVLAEKKKIAEYYRAHLPFEFQRITESNYGAVPILFKTQKERDHVFNSLAGEIEFKKYYVPLESGLKNTDDVYSRILCIPSWINVDYKEIAEKIGDVYDRM